MKTTYHKRLSPTHGACIDLAAGASAVYMVCRVYTHPNHRNKGHATKLLTQVLKDADTEEIRLVLDVHASGQMSNEALVKWYGKHGFTEQNVGTLQGLYLREPRTLNET